MADRDRDEKARCPEPECGKPTSGQDGPLTSDGTYDGAQFKCSGCGRYYTGRQATAAGREVGKRDDDDG